MAKRRTGLIALMLCCFLCFRPCTAKALSAASAKEPVPTDSNCTLTLFYRCDGAAFSGQCVKLYKIAAVSADAQYTLAPSFAASGLILNGIQTNAEWNVIRSTLETHILANSIAPTLTGVTDDSGQVCFAGLEPGLYLASPVRVSQDGLTCSFDSALAALPGLGPDGLWRSQISAAAKPEIVPPTAPEDDPPLLQWKVLKLWKGDEGRGDRPPRIEVEIFRNGSSFETVVLSPDNQWSYSWTAKDDGTSWNVVERNIPAGYAMTLEKRGTSFVLINTRSPDGPGSPDDPGSLPSAPPQTGDTSGILLYTVLMLVSGTILMILGIAEKRTRHEKTA